MQINNTKILRDKCNKYGDVAIDAVSICRSTRCSPREAWNRAAKKYFPFSESGQNKGCPRTAFLALCGRGLVCDIEPGCYVKSTTNETYVLNAYNKLKRDRITCKRELWCSVTNKKHNSQMDVLIALYKSDLLN